MNRINRSKYNARKAKADGIIFDSGQERDYYLWLKSEEERGEIKKMQLQPKYGLLERQEIKQINGKIKVYRPITYSPDFYVEWKDGRKEIIEVKGCKTEPYQMRKKMLLFKLRDRNDLTFVEI